MAARMIATYRADGVFRTLERAGAVPLSVGSESGPSTVPFSGNVESSRMLAVQRLIRVNVGRAALAARDGDKTEFLASIKTFLTLARAGASQPSSAMLELAFAGESAAHAAIRAWLLSDTMNPAWLPEIQTLLKNERVTPRPDMAFAGDQLITRCTVNLFFTQPEHFRFGRYSSQCQMLFRGVGVLGWNSVGTPQIRLGTYAQNIRELARHGDLFSPYFTVEAFARPDPSAMPTDSPAYATLGLLKLWNQPPSFAGIDEWAADRRGMDLWLALERRKARAGSYPATLDELVPEWINAVPVDPWSGKPPVFRRIDPRADLYERVFLLYFLGSGGIDDGGTGVGLGQPDGTGAPDLVVNDPRR